MGVGGWELGDGSWGMGDGRLKDSNAGFREAWVGSQDEARATSASRKLAGAMQGLHCRLFRKSRLLVWRSTVSVPSVPSVDVPGTRMGRPAHRAGEKIVSKFAAHALRLHRQTCVLMVGAAR